MTRVLLICGSQRAASLNGRLLAALATALPGGIAADTLRADEVDLPLFDGDQEDDPALVAKLRVLHARFLRADALIVASPEYNGLMTPFLKNLVDWVSRLPWRDATMANAFADKPVLLAAASPGWSGGAVGIPAARALFGYCGAVVFGEAITLPYADRALLPDGTLDPAFAGTWWRDCVARFAATATRMKGPLS
jgi:NAD(P)H-dependent FMN reductase